jgi:pimeloyl-ACP methyl ester carboxylesterase
MVAAIAFESLVPRPGQLAVAGTERFDVFRSRATYDGDSHDFGKFVGVDLAPFGSLSSAQWQHIARHSVVAGDRGTLRWHYDPAIADNFSPLIAFDAVLWHLWDEISCPVLVMRGETSDLLGERTLREMRQRGHAAAADKVEAIEWPGCGHAPSLMSDDQIAAVRNFLLKP